MGRSFYRAGDQLRKERNKGGKGDKIPGGFQLFFINIDGITQGLKSIKTNSDRKNDCQRTSVDGRSKKRKGLNKIIKKKIIIFKKTQEPKIYQNTDPKQPSADRMPLFFF